MAVKDARFIRELDLRYSGQGYELRTPLEGLYGERLDEQSLARVRVRFDERHAQIHGHAAKERPVEVLSYRLRTRVSVPKYQPRQEPAPERPASAERAIKGRRMIYCTAEEAVPATLYERDRLAIGSMLPGPAIVEQFDATIVVPPGWTARTDRHRNLILEKA